MVSILSPIGQQPLYWQLSAPAGPVNATHPARVTVSDLLGVIFGI
jgi:hypothetical protein